MSAENERNLVRSSLVPLLGTGLCLPLFAGARPEVNVLLGAFGLAAVMLAIIINALFASKVPKNFRIGFSLLVTGGILSIALIISGAARFPEQLPIASLAPLLVTAGIMAAENPAYDRSGYFARAIIDGGITGACFMAAVVLLGALRDLAMKTIAGPAGLPGTRSIPLVLVILAASAFIAEAAIKLKRGAS